MKNFLPNGSVVLLEGSNHRVMIYGRVQREKETGRLFDYAGCYYPEGVQDTGKVLLFNAEDIKAVFFIGFQDFEELSYRKALQEAYQKHTGEIF
jgi:hypothetical protein